MKITVHLKDGPDVVYTNVWSLSIIGGAVLGIYERGPNWDPDAPRLSINNDYGPNHKLILPSILGWSTEPEPEDKKAMTIQDIIDRELTDATVPPGFHTNFGREEMED